jgi:hypothetical protein
VAYFVWRVVIHFEFYPSRRMGTPNDPGDADSVSRDNRIALAASRIETRGNALEEIGRGTYEIQRDFIINRSTQRDYLEIKDEILAGFKKSGAWGVALQRFIGETPSLMDRRDYIGLGIFGFGNSLHEILQKSEETAHRNHTPMPKLCTRDNPMGVSDAQKTYVAATPDGYNSRYHAQVFQRILEIETEEKQTQIVREFAFVPEREFRDAIR